MFLVVRSYRRRFFRVLIVFIKIFFAFAKEFKLTRKYGYETAQKKMYRRHLKCAKDLYAVSVELGCIYIKLCQFLSTKHDVFPSAYIEVLSPLQDAVPAVPFSSIQQCLVTEYGDYNQIFSYFCEKPMAVASLGQVHYAILKNGEKVAVKVLKKEVEENVDFDFAILFHVIRLVENFDLISKHIDLPSLLNEFISVTSDELNFYREIFVAEKMHETLSKFSYLKIPKVYKNISTRRIIVMEYCEGVKIGNIEDFEKINCNPKILTDRLLEIFFEQFVFTRWVHLDPHPGNILVTANNRLVLLDFGMSAQITPDMSDAIARGVIAVMNQDSRMILRILQEQGFLRDNVNTYTLFTMIDFLLQEVAVVLNMNKQSIQTFDFTPIKKDFKNLITSEEIVIPVKWAYVGKTVASLAGFIAVLNPDFKIYEQIRKYVAKIVTRMPQVLVKSATQEIIRVSRLAYNLPERLTSLLDQYERGTLVVKTKAEKETISFKKRNYFFAVVLTFVLSIGVFKVVPDICEYSDIGLIFGGGMLFAYLLSIFFSRKRE